MATYSSFQKPLKLDKHGMRNTAREVRINSKVTSSYRALHMDKQVLDDQQELIFNSSVYIQDVVSNTSQKRWVIETNGKRELGKSELTASHDGVCVYIYIYIYIYIDR